MPVKRPNMSRKPANMQEDIDFLKFYLAKCVKALKIEDTDNDPKWG